MTAWDETMARPDQAGAGPGEARERARSRKRNIVLGLLFLAGLLSGLYVGHQEGEALFAGGDGAWSPALSLALAGIFLVAVIGGSLLLQSSLDELDRLNSYKAATVAGGFYTIAYPLWFVLWKGGLVREPVHWLVFVGFVATLCAAHLWFRFR